MVSVAYIDPGNYGTDISGGASFGYSMLWVVWLASIMAMLLQYLSGNLESRLAILSRSSYGSSSRREYVLPYWLASEVSAAMTDLAEFLGTVLALNLLFRVPLIIGTFLSVLDVILILGITHGRVRRMEYLFLVFVSIIGIGYVYEIFITAPSLSLVAAGSVHPRLDSADRILVAVGVVGATVMPHAVFLHSSLTNDKVTDTRLEVKRRTMRFHRLESIIMFTFAGLVNAAIMIMAAAAFYVNGSQVATIDEAYRTLTPLFRPTAAVVFGITLLSSGLSSSTTGTLAGQAIMEGMLGRKFNIWVRRIVTRLINTVPTTLAILAGLDPLLILVYSQVALSLMLPLPLLPLVKFTRDRNIMGVFTNGKLTTIFSIIFVGIILSLNAVLIFISFGGKI